MLNPLIRLIDTASELAAKLSAWIFFVIGFAITYEVIVRNDLVREWFGTSPTLWVDETAAVLQVWAAYLTAAYSLKNHQMIRIEILFRKPDTLGRKLSDSLSIILILLFAGVAAWFGVQLWLNETLAGHTTDSYLGLPKWFTEAAVWLSFSLLALQAVAELIKLWSPEQVTKG